MLHSPQSSVSCTPIVDLSHLPNTCGVGTRPCYIVLKDMFLALQLLACNVCHVSVEQVYTTMSHRPQSHVTYTPVPQVGLQPLAHLWHRHTGGSDGPQSTQVVEEEVLKEQDIF